LEEEIGYASDGHLGVAFDDSRDLHDGNDLADLARLKAEWNFKPEEKKSSRTDKAKKRKKDEGVFKVMHVILYDPLRSLILRTTTARRSTINHVLEYQTL
jgi:hypothetical protein